jgi:hypothetical protein
MFACWCSFSASSNTFRDAHHQNSKVDSTACSFGLSATSQQYFSLRTNQPQTNSQQYFSLTTNQHQPSATSQTNRLLIRLEKIARMKLKIVLE